MPARSHISSGRIETCLFITSNSIQRRIPQVESAEVTILQIYRAVKEQDVNPETVAEAHDITKGEVYEALVYAHNRP